jgi:hypothetical protein
MCRHHEQIKDATMMHNESLKELPMHKQQEQCKTLQWNTKKKFERIGSAQKLKRQRMFEWTNTSIKRIRKKVKKSNAILEQIW